MHMVFINLKKAYYKLLRDLIYWVLNKRNVPKGYTKIVKDLYEEEVTSVRATYGGITQVNSL